MLERTNYCQLNEVFWIEEKRVCFAPSKADRSQRRRTSRPRLQQPPEPRHRFSGLEGGRFVRWVAKACQTFAQSSWFLTKIGWFWQNCHFFPRKQPLCDETFPLNFWVVKFWHVFYFSSLKTRPRLFAWSASQLICAQPERILQPCFRALLLLVLGRLNFC